MSYLCVKITQTPILTIMSDLTHKNGDDAPGHYCYRYPHAAITADCVVFGFDGNSLKVLLIERNLEPYMGYWALPGGFMHINETIDEAARRELKEETNLEGVYLTQFKVYSTVDRDPRERVVTVAFIGLVRPSLYQLVAGDDAGKAMWFDESMLPPLAFDHATIIGEAREHLSEALRIKPVAFNLLDRLFTVAELQRIYEIINRTEYDRRNFQRKLMQADILEEHDQIRTNGPSRPARLYSFKRAATESHPEPSMPPQTCCAAEPSGCPDDDNTECRSVRQKAGKRSIRDLFDF